MLDLICIICQATLEETDDVYATLCGHIFHQACIRPWLNDSRSCPQCRRACPSSSIYKLYIESALERSNNANHNTNQNAEMLHRQELDMLEEVNLNLARDLAASEDKFDKCEAKLVCLQLDHEKMQDNLLEEIHKREDCEMKIVELEKIRTRLTALDHSIQAEYIQVQNDLKREISSKKVLEEQVAELEREKLNLTYKINRLETHNKLVKHGLAHHDDRKENTEKRMTELENKLEKEIEARQFIEKRLTPQKTNEVRSVKMLHNSSHIDDDTYEKKDIASDAILFGIPHLPSQSLQSIFNKLCHTIGCIPFDLKAIYRSRDQKQTDSPIIVKFVRPMERNAVLKAMTEYRKKINRPLIPQDIGIESPSGKTIYMRENLTVKNRLLLEQAFNLKHRKKLFSVYTQFGSVYVKRTAHCPGVKIENEATLNSIAWNSVHNITRTAFPSLPSLPSAIRCESFFEPREDEFGISRMLKNKRIPIIIPKF